jgi:hypothetical protein
VRARACGRRRACVRACGCACQCVSYKLHRVVCGCRCNIGAVVAVAYNAGVEDVPGSGGGAGVGGRACVGRQLSLDAARGRRVARGCVRGSPTKPRCRSSTIPSPASLVRFSIRRTVTRRPPRRHEAASRLTRAAHVCLRCSVARDAYARELAAA